MKKVLIELLCTECGQELTYNPTTQTSSCNNCDNKFFLSDRKTIDEHSSDNNCPNCGAVLDYSDNAQKIICASCGSGFALIRESKETKKQDKIKLVTPFSVPMDNATSSFIQWLAEGEFCPNDIYEKTHSVEIEGVFSPLYVYTINYDVNWSASIGYDRQVKRDVYDEVSKRWTTRYETVTDWEPYSSSFSGSTREQAIVSSSWRKPPWLELMPFCEEMSIGEPVDFEERYITGYKVSTLDFSDKTALSEIIEPKLSELVRSEVEDIRMGDRIKDLRWNYRYNTRSTHLMYRPLWMFKYRYNANTFSFVANGCSLSEISGTKPEDEERKTQVNGPLIFAIILLIITIILFFIIPDVAVGTLIFTIILFIVYGVKRSQINTESAAIRMAKQKEVMKDITGFLNKRQPQATDIGVPVASQNQRVTLQHAVGQPQIIGGETGGATIPYHPGSPAYSNQTAYSAGISGQQTTPAQPPQKKKMHKGLKIAIIAAISVVLAIVAVNVAVFFIIMNEINSADYTTEESFSENGGENVAEGNMGDEDMLAASSNLSSVRIYGNEIGSHSVSRGESKSISGKKLNVGDTINLKVEIIPDGAASRALTSWNINNQNIVEITNQEEFSFTFVATAPGYTDVIFAVKRDDGTTGQLIEIRVKFSIAETEETDEIPPFRGDVFVTAKTNQGIFVRSEPIVDGDGKNINDGNKIAWIDSGDTSVELIATGKEYHEGGEGYWWYEVEIPGWYRNTQEQTANFAGRPMVGWVRSDVVRQVR